MYSTKKVPVRSLTFMGTAALGKKEEEKENADVAELWSLMGSFHFFARQLVKLSGDKGNRK